MGKDTQCFRINGQLRMKNQLFKLQNVHFISDNVLNIAQRVFPNES